MSLRRLAHAQPRRFTRAEYDKLCDLGFFEGEQVELVRGIVVDMKPGGTETGATSFKLSAMLSRALGDRAKVAVRQAFVAADESEPEPDVMVIGDDPNDPMLVVEVADASLDYDRTTKAWLYAESNVPEYWVVDVATRGVEVFRGPSGERYDRVDRFDGDDTLTIKALPGVSLAVSELFPGDGDADEPEGSNE